MVVVVHIDLQPAAKQPSPKEGKEGKKKERKKKEERENQHPRSRKHGRKLWRWTEEAGEVEAKEEEAEYGPSTTFSVKGTPDKAMVDP
ncbi:unnamed protein product [Calypogeia fissa]